jgi:hypothetical protein
MTSAGERPIAPVGLMGAGRSAAAGVLGARRRGAAEDRAAAPAAAEGLRARGRFPTRRLRDGLVACLAVLSLASCAPRPARLALLDAGGRETLYRTRLVGREERACMAVGEATLWARGPGACDTCAPSRLPAVQAELAVLAPESFRLRVRSAFGTAVDLGLRGDSLTVYAPGLGLGAALDAVRDSLGPAGVGGLAARLVAAAWRPPGGATAVWRDGGLDLRWRDGEDSVAVTVDEGGLPVGVRLWRDAGAGARVRYDRWEVVDGVAWPMSWSLDAVAGGPGVTCRVDRVAFAPRPDPERLAVRIPGAAERIGAGEVRRLLGTLGLSR